MKHLLTASAMFVCSFSISALATASTGCSIAQVMKTVHQKPAYRRYEYASNYAGEQGPPTQKQNENNDQYLFWVDENGETCPAIVTYESGKCSGGTAIVKTGECQ